MLAFNAHNVKLSYTKSKQEQKIMPSITIFARNWWEADGETPQYGAPKRKIKTVDSEEEAIEFCKEGNATRSKAWIKRGRKYEWD